jgi:recombinational DNA repair protein RecT
MTKDELNKIQKSAASGEGPWRSWPERMALKTVLKRLAQVLPTSTDDDLRKAVAYDSLSEAGKLRFKEGEIIEGETVEVRQEAVEAIHAAETTEELDHILSNLPVDERKKAASLAQARLEELA